MPRARTVLVSVVLAIVSLAIYADRLQTVPVYLTPDEVLISLDAREVAVTGHDLRGRHLPLFFQMSEASEQIWYQPAIMYATALVLKVLPLTESSVRLPAAVIGMLDVLLMYWVARLLFQSETLGVFAAGLLALTPAHFMHSRFAMDYLYPVPFVLAWLLCLVLYDQRRQVSWLFMATLGLGIGMYSYIAAVFMMPLYLAMTAVVVGRELARPRVAGAAAAGFLAPVLVFIVWFVRHPTVLGDTLARYGMQDSMKADAVPHAVTVYADLVARTRLYWDYFSPSLLFFNGGGHAMFTTGMAGVFLFPVALLLPLGVYHIVSRRWHPWGSVLLAGFATAPLAAMLLKQGGQINRELEILPFGVLLAVAGVQYAWTAVLNRSLRGVYLPASIMLVGLGGAYAAVMLLTRARLSGPAVATVGLGALIAAIGVSCERTRGWRPMVVALVAVGVVQFVDFRRDYFGEYPGRSVAWFHLNIRGGVEAILDHASREDVPGIYLSTNIEWVEQYWKFYALKHHREALLARTRAMDPTQVNARDVLPGTLFLVRAGDADSDRIADALVGQGFHRERLIRELNDNQTASFVLLQR